MRRVLPLLAVLLLPFPGVRPPTPAPAPAPTEHLLDPDAETRNREGRERWIESLHRTPPGVDWRAIERENGLARMERRNAMLAQQGAGRAVTYWAELGSRNLAGRMHAAALSADGDSLYGGSSLGGIWKADAGGNGWRPLSDNLYGGTHGIAVAAGPPETVTRITDNGLVHWSDDGLAWTKPTGIGTVLEAKRVLHDASDPDLVYLLVRKNLGWRLYRSTDRGQSYSRIGNAPSDVWLDRQVGGRIWTTEGSTVQYSDDRGAGWTQAGTLPVTPSDILLTGSEAGAPTLYAAVLSASQWDLYRSTDAGASWSWRHTITDFWETIAASITDPDLVLYGGVELWRSTNGGSSFNKVNGWAEYYGDPVNKLHADLPGLDVVWTPGGQEIFYIATDGGLYRSDDGVATVTNISQLELGVSQYYSTHTSVNDPDLVVAGSQDQGYQRSTGPAMGSWRDFTQLISGDYGHLTSGDGTHARVFSVYPGFVLVQEGETNPVLRQEPFPSNETQSWMPYIVADPRNTRDFWFCATHLQHYHVTSFGVNITPSAQDFTVAGGAFLTAVAVAPTDTNRMIAVTDTGVFWTSTDAGGSWTLSTDTGPSSHYFYGTALEFFPANPSEAYAGGSGYGVPAVYRTTDAGASWIPVSAGLPSTLVYDLAYEGGANGVVYAATEAGPYRLDPGTDTWTSLDDPDVPLTLFWSVESVPAAGVMRFGTYGRGIWDYQIDAATSVADLTTQGDGGSAALGSYPNPFHGRTTIRYAVPREGPVSLRIYDVTGRLVRTVVDAALGSGQREVAWDGRDDAGRAVAAGVYTARLETTDGARTRRVTLLR